VVTTAPLVASTLASGFDAPGQQLVSQLIRILAPTILLTGLWGLLTTLLDAEGLFIVSAISRAWPAVGVIGAVLLISQHLEVYSLPIGLLVAAVCQVVWTAYWLWRKGVRYRFVLDLNDHGLRQFLALLWPCVVGSSLGYFISIIDRWMASHLLEGTVSALSYANKPMSILSRIGIFSLNTVLLPALSQQSVGSDLRSFKKTMVQALGMLVFVMMPLSMLLAALRMPLIQLLFQRGKFDSFAAANTASIFGGYALGLVPMAVAITLSTGFNALEDTKSQSFFGAGSNFASKIVFNPILILAFGATGISLATSLMYVVSATLLLLILRRRLQGIGNKHLLETSIKVLAASLLAVGPVLLIVNHLYMPSIVVISISMLVGSILYLVFAALLQIPELKLAYKYLLRLMASWYFSFVQNQTGIGSEPSGSSAETPCDVAN
jgi:putative peptidoglycan lipid II flippase